MPVLRHLPRSKPLAVATEVIPGILEAAQTHDLIVMGASSRADALKPQPLGPITTQVASRTSTGLIIVKSPTPDGLVQDNASTYRKRALSILTDKWFAENTFDADEFAELGRLSDVKQELGVTISLGLPALNEEETVGKVIEALQQALVKEVPLLDEIVLIDSGSDDRTREIAQRCGVPIYIHQEILPQHGSYRGKGEALWKSLYVLKGDLIAWIDTDIVNIHPRFVYGVLGPLLRHDRIQYVKGFYRRPIRVGDKLQAGGGGRVTELVTRPMFNLFFPELSGLIQPLSGEYAGRRSALEQDQSSLSHLVHYYDKTFESFDLRAGELKLEERRNLEEALTYTRIYAESPQGWLAIFGAYGSGKTHLAAAIANRRAAKGYATLFVVVPDLLDHLRAAFSPQSGVTFDQRFEEVRSAALLILDDLGTESATPWAREKLYQIVNHRHTAHLPTVITTSLAPDELDPRIRSRILDETSCRLISILAPNYRGRNLATRAQEGKRAPSSRKRQRP